MPSNYPDGVSGSDDHFNPTDECPECDYRVEDDWNYCPICGTDLSGEQGIWIGGTE